MRENLRFTVDEYHRLIEFGILTEDDNVELLEGYLVQKLTRNSRHACTIHVVYEQLDRRLRSGWVIRIHSGVTLSDSEPEPSLVVVRGHERSYMARHPGPADVGLIVEVADATLARDRLDKGRIYARAKLACYWIVNLIDDQVEVYTAPSGLDPNPAYAQHQDYRRSDSVPLVIDGTTLATIPVAELLP